MLNTRHTDYFLVLGCVDLQALLLLGLLHVHVPGVAAHLLGGGERGEGARHDEHQAEPADRSGAARLCRPLQHVLRV